MSLIKRAFVDPNKCKVCKECMAMENCPASAMFKEDPDEAPYVEPHCAGCAKCTKMCRHMAISMV